MTTVDRRTLLAHLQREMVPFLSTPEIDERLGCVEAADVLAEHVTGGRYDLIGCLNACLYDHPALFQAREDRGLGQETEWLDGGALGAARASYRIEQRVEIHDRVLPDGSVLHLFLPAPRDLPPVQRARLVAADPPMLADHYVARAGLIYAARVVVEPGRRPPPLRLVYEVETRVDAALAPRGLVHRAPAAPAAAWASRASIGGAGCAREVVEAVVDQLEESFPFALAGPMDAPAETLLAVGAGDVAMHAALLVEALAHHGIAARIGAAQRLFLDAAGRSELRYPGSAAYDHVYVEWCDRDRDEAGVVDLTYLGRWGFVASETNAPREELRWELDRVGTAARHWMRRHLYPIDLVVAGVAPASRVVVLATGAQHWLPAPVDVTIVAERVARGAA